MERKIDAILLLSMLVMAMDSWLVVKVTITE